MPERLVVVGASLAGLRAVEAAQRADPDLAITLVGDEPHAPYDRPPLSKDLLAVDAERAETEFRPVDDLRAAGVELRLGEPATGLDLTARVVTVGGADVPYDRLVLATGSSPRRLPGTDGLAGVHTMRGIDDSRAIRAALDAGARTVVIGAGFIGAEIASAARARDLDVTVVEALPTPLVRAVGAPAGGSLARLHRDHGTTLLTDAKVAGLEGDDHVTGVRLADGTLLPADLVVVGVGADPNTGWLEGSGLTVDDGVVCNETLRAADNVWAAGDIARWPNAVFGRSMRVEHWTNAAEQGVRAGRNAAHPDAAEPYASVPYFWSDWYGSRIQFVGVPSVDETEVVWGDADADHFLTLYREGDRVAGALALNGQGVIMRIRKLIAGGAAWDTALDAARALPSKKREA